ncbi:MAG: hypothetical protein IJ120_07880 [Solobacterium sp.]|nr:hypothetical protein [Solobacterium sp.]
MLQFIKIPKASVTERPVYIWDIGTLAMWVLLPLINRGVRISGFVTNYSEYCGETILNLPVISPEEFAETNGVIIANDEISDGTFALVQSFGEAYRMKDIMVLNPLLSQSSLYVYGTGNRIWRFLKEAGEKHIEIKGILSETGPEEILSVPVTSPKETVFTPNDCIVVCNDIHSKDAVTVMSLRKDGFAGTLFIPELTPLATLWSTDTVTVLDTAMKEDKRIILVSADDDGKEIVRRFISMYGIPVARELILGGADDIWSLADEDPADSVILIQAMDLHQRCDIVDAVNDLGYSLGQHNYVSVQQACYNRLRTSETLAYEHDFKIGSSIDYSGIGGLPGWRIYGEEPADCRIMVLGGSTSSEVYYPENWVSKLFRKISSEGKHVRIYNGAVEGNAVYHEFNRLIRDIHALKPDIVISMSGYNDMRTDTDKFENWRGEARFPYWRRMQSYMKLIAESEGASYYAFLQPVNRDPEHLSLHEVMRYLGQVHRRGKLFTDGQRDDDFYINLYSAFVHRDECYIDLSHYSEEGTSRLAELVYDAIKEELK